MAWLLLASLTVAGLTVASSTVAAAGDDSGLPAPSAEPETKPAIAASKPADAGDGESALPGDDSGLPGEDESPLPSGNPIDKPTEKLGESAGNVGDGTKADRPTGGASTPPDQAPPILPFADGPNAGAGDDTGGKQPETPGDPLASTPGITVQKSPKDGANLPFLSSRTKVRLTVHAARLKLTPGAEAPVAVVFDHDPGFHVHTNEPKLPADVAKSLQIAPTQVEVMSAGPGVTAHAGFIAWPKPHTIAFAITGEPIDYPVFSGRAVVYLPVTVAADAKPGKAPLKLTVHYQACDDRTCKMTAIDDVTIPFEIVSADVAAKAGASGAAADAPLFKDFPIEVWAKLRSGEQPAELVKFDVFGYAFTIDVSSGAGVALLLLVAALGGMLLNFTPCVLPVIPLKIMGLAQTAGHRGRTFALGLTMSVGIVAFWAALGGVIAATAAAIARATAAGENASDVGGITSSNQLFQYPAFTIGVGVIIAVMAIGMCGLFTIGLPKWVYRINPKHDTFVGSFLFGIMTAVLSTPCTAPFMGAAAAWATKQSAATTLTTFGVIGLGMALPYAVLTAFPKLVEKMPRTGPASELIKQVMGGLMLAAAAFFIGSGLSGALVEAPDPPSKLYWWLVFGISAATGLWLGYRTFAITKKTVNRLTYAGVGMVIVLVSIGGARATVSTGPIDWVYYTPERFEKAIAEGQVVVMDFTAEWCLNCKALETSVLHRKAIATLLNSDGVAPIKVDITGNNPLGNAMLKKADRVAIPLLVVYAPPGDGKTGSEPIEVFKSDFYTVQQVLDAVAKAQGKATNTRSPDSPTDGPKSTEPPDSVSNESDPTSVPAKRAAN